MPLEMRRWEFLKLLGLIGCSEDMLLAQHGIIGKQVLLEKHVFVAIGDSNAAGKGRTLGPVTAPDTLYRWNGATLDEITTTDISTNPPENTYGTSYKQFAIDYKQLYNKSVVMICEGSSGAEFYPNGDNNNWYTTGTLYAAMQTEVANCLSFVGAASLTGIILNLGINDVRGAQTIANINTAIDSLFTRLTADFPGVPVLVVQVGTYEGPTLNSARVYSVRKRIRTNVWADSSRHMVSNNAAFFKFGVTDDYYDDEDLHLDQSGNNLQGSQFAAWFGLSGYSERARDVISCIIQKPSTARMDLIADFVDSQVSSGNWALIEGLFIFKTNHRDNIYLGWAGLFMITDNVAQVDFNVNSDIQTDGSTKFMATVNHTVVDQSISSQNDFLYGVKLKSNDSTNPSNGTLFGGRLSAILPTILCLQISGGNRQYMCNDITASTSSSGQLENDTLHIIARNGTSKYYYKDTTQISTVVQASTGRNNDAVCIGALNTNNVRNLFFAGKYEYMIFSSFASFNLSDFHSNIETLIDNW